MTTADRLASTVTRVEIIDAGKTCKLTLSMQSLTFGNMTTASESVCLPLAKVVRHGLWVGVMFETVCLHDKGGAHVGSNHRYHLKLSSIESAQAHVLQTRGR